MVVHDTSSLESKSSESTTRALMPISFEDDRGGQSG